MVFPSFVAFVLLGLVGFGRTSLTPPALVEDTLSLRCGMHPCAGAVHSNDRYHCGDPRLGPVQLPTRITLGPLVHAYRRFGGICPGLFLQRWFNVTTNSYNYPPLNGFQLDTAGKPILGLQTLPAGTKVDRFGSLNGNFLSPAGAPYSQRAIPPSNLATPSDDTSFPYNYHVYEVLKPFDVLSGPIAGWFEQPGQGVQYYCATRINDLIAGGFLRREVSSRSSGNHLLQVPK